MRYAHQFVSVLITQEENSLSHELNHAIGSFAISLIELMVNEEKIGEAPSFLKPKEAKLTAAASISCSCYRRLYTQALVF